MSRKSDVRTPHVSSPSATTAVRPNRTGLAAAVVLLLLVALGLRFWHDRQADKTPLSVPEAAQRARANPNDLSALLAWGTALQAEKRSDEALEVFTRASQLDPKDPRAYAWLGFISMTLRRGAEARAYLTQAAERGSSDPDVWRSLLTLHEQAKEFGAAARAGEQWTRLRPEDGEAWHTFGKVCEKAGLSERALDAFRQAAARKPDDAALLSDLAGCAATLGQLPEAKAASDKALAKQPDDPKTLAVAAYIALRLNPTPDNLARAEEQVNRSLSLRPTANARQIRGELHLQQRRYAEAIADFQTALKLDPGYVNVLASLSQAYAGAKQPEKAREAAEQYQKAVRQRAQQNGLPSSAGRAAP